MKYAFDPVKAEIFFLVIGSNCFLERTYIFLTQTDQESLKKNILLS